jgi:excisionase family DNA binding protein
MHMSEIIDKGPVTDGPAVAPKRRGRPVQSFEQHYTINDACALLCITRSTIYEWIKQGLFAYVIKTPGGTRIPASVLNQFAESRRIECQK